MLPSDCETIHHQNCIRAAVPYSCGTDIDLWCLLLQSSPILENLQYVLTNSMKTIWRMSAQNQHTCSTIVLVSNLIPCIPSLPLLLQPDFLNGNNLPLHLLNLAGKVNIIGPRPPSRSLILSHDWTWWLVFLGLLFPCLIGCTPRILKRRSYWIQAIDGSLLLGLRPCCPFVLSAPMNSGIHCCMVFPALQYIHLVSSYSTASALASFGIWSFFAANRSRTAFGMGQGLWRRSIVTGILLLHSSGTTSSITTIHLATELPAWVLLVSAQWGPWKQDWHLGHEVHQHSTPFLWIYWNKTAFFMPE